jgi:archaellum component FlaC
MTQREFDELVTLLKQNPVLRKQLLDALGLPDGTTLSAQAEEVNRQLAILAERINALTESLDRLTKRVEELAEIQRALEETTCQRFQQMEERFDRVELRIDGVQQRLGGVEQEMGQVKERLGGVEGRLGGVEQEMGQVKEKVSKVGKRVDPLAGWYLEERYRRHAYAYFGRFLKQIRVVAMEEIEKRFGQVLTDADLQDLYNLDIIIQGSLPNAQNEEVFLAVEVSTEIEKRDVDRAVRRAAILRDAGVRCLPVVGGERIGNRAEKAVKAQQVIVITNGKIEGWEEAFIAY